MALANRVRFPSDTNSTGMGRSVYLNCLLFCILLAVRQGGNLMLINIQQRKAWEAQFDNSYIKPTFGGNKVCYGLRCFQKFAKGSYPKSLSPRHNALKNMINPWSWSNLARFLIGYDNKEYPLRVFEFLAYSLNESMYYDFDLVILGIPVKSCIRWMLLTRPIEVIARYERFRFPTSSVTDSYAIDKSLGTLREWLKCHI